MKRVKLSPTRSTKVTPTANVIAVLRAKLEADGFGLVRQPQNEPSNPKDTIELWSDGKTARLIEHGKVREVSALEALRKWHFIASPKDDSSWDTEAEVHWIAFLERSLLSTVATHERQNAEANLAAGHYGLVHEINEQPTEPWQSLWCNSEGELALRGIGDVMKWSVSLTEALQWFRRTTENSGGASGSSEPSGLLNWYRLLTKAQP